MKRRIDVVLEPFGMNGTVVLGFPKYKEWMDVAGDIETATVMQSNLRMIKMCVKEAPFPNTEESLADLDADLIVELTAGVMELVGPLSEKMAGKSTSVNSNSPKSPTTPDK